MEMNNKQREFIILRADGISFDKIATQLKVSAPADLFVQLASSIRTVLK